MHICIEVLNNRKKWIDIIFVGEVKTVYMYIRLVSFYVSRSYFIQSCFILCFKVRGWFSYCKVVETPLMAIQILFLNLHQWSPLMSSNLCVLLYKFVDTGLTEVYCKLSRTKKYNIEPISQLIYLLVYT